MRSIFIIAQHESRRIFNTPLAWVLLALFQLILGIGFYLSLREMATAPETLAQSHGVSDYICNTLFGTAAIVLLMLIPLLTMRLFAEEKKNGALHLLTSAPVQLNEIVLGKYLGLLSFFLTLCFLLLLMPLSLAYGTHLDYGRIATGLLGAFLMMMSFSAASLFISSLSREPVIAAAGGFALLLVLLLIEAFAYSTGSYAGLFQQISLLGHFEKFRRGVLSTGDLLYYLIFIALFLWLTVQRLDLDRT